MTINVTKYRLNPDRIFAGTRGSYGMEKLSFDFGDGWDFDTISVTFHPQRGKPIRVPLLPGEEIDIPAEVMEHSGETRFVVSGRVIGEDGAIERQAITLEGYVDVAYTADEKGGNTRKITPDVYDQLIDQASKVFNEAREDVSRSAEEAAESASDAEGFANSAEENAEAAKVSAEQASEAAKSASDAKESAQNAVREVSSAADQALRDIESAADAEIDDLTAAGTGQIQRIETAAEEEIQTVRSEGATQVGAIRGSVEELTERAETAAGTAETARSDAQNAAGEAEAAEARAKSSASSASTASMSAMDYSNQASRHSDTASVYAGQARTSASNAETSATNATASKDAAETASAEAKSAADRVQEALGLYPTITLIPLTVQPGMPNAFLVTVKNVDGTIQSETIENGVNGITPNIGYNGNWWIGSVDTGVLARGVSSEIKVTRNEAQKYVMISASDADGATIAFVYDGKDYVLTDEDKREIADMVNAFVGGLPEHTVADEGKSLRIINNAAAWTDGDVRYIASRTLRVGDNVLTDDMVTLGAGWSGNLTDGFTHASGSTEPLTFAVGAADGESYLVEGTYTDYSRDRGLLLALGDSYETDPYEGTGTLCWGLTCVGADGALKLIPSSGYTGTVTNLTCKKISDSGTEEVEVEMRQISHDDHENHLTGFWNVAMGYNALGESVNSTRNIAVGRDALGALKTGGRNIGIGTYAMPRMETGENNISLGADSMFYVDRAEDCITFGKGAMYYGKKLRRNIAIGTGALTGDTNGADTESEENIAVGYMAGYKCSSKNNIFIGTNAGYSNNKYNNIFIGSNAGRTTAGYNNIAIGNNAENGVYDNNIAIGANANNAGKDKCIAIGAGAKNTKHNQTVIGADSNVETVVKGNFIVRGTDGVMRQIVFNDDGTCSWTEVS